MTGKCFNVHGAPEGPDGRIGVNVLPCVLTHRGSFLLPRVPPARFDRAASRLYGGWCCYIKPIKARAPMSIPVPAAIRMMQLMSNVQRRSLIVPLGGDFVSCVVEYGHLRIVVRKGRVILDQPFREKRANDFVCRPNPNLKLFNVFRVIGIASLASDVLPRPLQELYEPDVLFHCRCRAWSV